ncbi:MAG: HDOD domain-containing protein [Deltaproteobacteria bacterium]|nr:HDOD domain-containing protein [Deltaproteobacteria bacterium]
MPKTVKQNTPQRGNNPKGRHPPAGVIPPFKGGITPFTAALPSLPEKAQRVLSLLSDTDVSVEKLRRLIAADAALASKILNIANFDFYGGGKTMPDLTHAIMRLGFNAVRNIVVATSLRAVFKRFGRDEELLWTAMMGCAIASSIIARHTKLVDPEDAFIGGLLHDVGMVYLINEAPALYGRLQRGDTPIQIAEARNNPIADDGGIPPFNQRNAGAGIVKKWGFPETLAALLKKFDNPDEFINERYMYNLVTVITFADMICLTLGIGGRGIPSSGVMPPTMKNLSDSLGIAEKGFKKLVENVHEAFSQGIKLY